MKWYLLQNYKPYWNNESEALPDKHIEDIVNERTNDSINWVEIPEAKINWGFPMEEAVLTSSNNDMPYYLKGTDGKDNYYFYFGGISGIVSELNDEYTYQSNYILDRYMTIYRNKFEILLKNNVNVRHLRRFTDRLEYIVEDGTIKEINVDYIKSKQFGNSIEIKNNQMVRNFIYGTNPTKLWNNNYSDLEIPEKVHFKNWAAPEFGLDILWQEFINPNHNYRFGYIVCKSSAFQTGKTTTTFDKWNPHGRNTKLIIPLFNSYIKDIHEGLINFNPLIEQKALLNALSNDNFIGYYECDIPYSLFYGLSEKDPENCKRWVGDNYLNADQTNTKNIMCFEIPTNYAPLWTIINFNEYSKGIDGLLKNLVRNQYDWNIQTEPTLINPRYYQERCAISNEHFLSSELSLINWKLDIKNIETSGLTLKARVMFDSNISIAYDYNDFNNQLNPLWNNKNSNLQNQVSVLNGVYGSASANFYANNANTLITGIANRQSEQTQAWMDEGFNYAETAISSIGKITDMKNKPWTKSAGGITGIINSILGIANRATDTKYQQDRANRSLASKINNISSSASITLSNPFIDSGIPNKVINGNYLFNTFSNELHPWDKDINFKYILNNGYLTDKDDLLNAYNNRIHMNVLNIDTTYYTDTLLNTLINNDNSIFRGINYNYDFLSWLGDLHRLYKNNYLINVTVPEQADYLNNIEINFPPLPDIKININTLITNINVGEFMIGEKMNNQVINKLKELNQEVPSDLWDYIDIYNIQLHNLTLKVKENTKYYGDCLINGTFYALKIVDINNNNLYWPKMNYKYLTTKYLQNPFIFIEGISIPSDSIKEIYFTVSNEEFQFINETAEGFCYRMINLETLHFIENKNIKFMKYYKFLNFSFSVCPKLKNFKWEYWPYCSDIGDFCFNNIGLESIDLQLFQIHNIGVSFLSNCVNLKVINLQLSVFVKIEGNDFIRYNNKLEVINFNNIFSKITKTSNALSVKDTSAPAYLNGVLVEGLYKEEWLKQLPNLTGPIYRNLK